MGGGGGEKTGGSTHTAVRISWYFVILSNSDVQNLWHSNKQKTIKQNWKVTIENRFMAAHFLGIWILFVSNAQFSNFQFHVSFIWSLWFFFFNYEFGSIILQFCFEISNGVFFVFFCFVVCRCAFCCWLKQKTQANVKCSALSPRCRRHCRRRCLRILFNAKEQAKSHRREWERAFALSLCKFRAQLFSP